MNDQTTQFWTKPKKIPDFLTRLKKSGLFAKKNLGLTKEPPTFAPEPVG